MTETDLTQEHLAADAEFAAFGWSPAELNVADDAGVKQTLSGYTRDGLGTAWTPEGWTLWALTANHMLGALPTVSAVRRLVKRIAPLADWAALTGAGISPALETKIRLICIEIVESELQLAREAVAKLEADIDYLLDSANDLRAKAILFSNDDD